MRFRRRKRRDEHLSFPDDNNRNPATYRVDFYNAVESGDREHAAMLAACLALGTVGLERARWERWERALQRKGGRIKVGTYPVEIVAGEDLAALDALRAAETAGDLIEEKP